SSALLSFTNTNKGGSYITEEEKQGETEKIEVKALDKVLPEIEKVGLIKIDVEGYEFKVLQGAEKTIRNNMPIILFEQHEYDFTNSTSPSIEFLKKVGYKKYAVLRKFPRVKGNFFKQLLINPLLVLIFGDQTRIELVRNIVPDFYEFIVALPDWLPLENSPS
ncbi:uncharacterized protein METZ01_LOCUS310145, partial [marine metagenome]